MSWWLDFQFLLHGLWNHYIGVQCAFDITGAVYDLFFFTYSQMNASCIKMLLSLLALPISSLTSCTSLKRLGTRTAGQAGPAMSATVPHNSGLSFPNRTPLGCDVPPPALADPSISPGWPGASRTPCPPRPHLHTIQHTHTL